jgi:MFS family permease
MTQAPRHTRPPARPRLVTVPLALTFLSEFSVLTSFFLLLSVMPMVAAAAGTGSAGAGLITGALLTGTVAAEIAAAPAISRLGYRAVLAAGAILLGAPALVLLTRQPQAVMAGISFVRGTGFGLCGVATGGLTATLLPAERRGEGLGLLGIVSGVPAVLALPAGVWLAGHHLATAAAVMAAVAGLIPLAVIRRLPGTAAPGRPAVTEQRRASRRTSRYRLPLIFAAATVGAGVLDSFLPLARGVPASIVSAALLVEAAAATLSRHGPVRHGLRRPGERDVCAADRAAARGPRECTVEPRLRRRLRGRAGRVRTVRRPHRLPGGLRPDRRPDAGRASGRPAGTAGRAG